IAVFGRCTHVFFLVCEVMILASRARRPLPLILPVQFLVMQCNHCKRIADKSEHIESSMTKSLCSGHKLFVMELSICSDLSVVVLSWGALPALALALALRLPCAMPPRWRVPVVDLSGMRNLVARCQ